MNKDLKSPIIKSSSISQDQINSGYVPVYTSEVDSVISVLKTIKALFVPGKRVKSEYIKYSTGNGEFNIRRYRYEKNDLYSITFSSKFNGLGSAIVVSNKRDSYKKTLGFIDRLIGYLEGAR